MVILKWSCYYCMSNFLNLFIKGIFVGIANIIPGVSGGTIAVVLRIFDDLIDAINNFLKNPSKHLKFLVPIICGAGFGILMFSKILEFALEKYSMPTSMFFVGLVVGSIPLIYGQAKKRAVLPMHYVASVISFIIVVGLSFVSDTTGTGSISDIVVTPMFLIQVFVSCIIASSAMIIPGISGSFVMILLGIYNIILVSISGLLDAIIQGLEIIVSGEFIEGVKHVVLSNSFIIILVGGLGIVFGVIIVSKIIEYLLENFFSMTYFSILGLIGGSVVSILKDPMTYSSYEVGEFIGVGVIIISMIMSVIGFVIAYKLGEE